MRYLFTRAFWGFILILLGILLLARNVFNIDIPVWGLLWSLLFIWLGIGVLFRPVGVRSEKEVIFNEGAIEANPKNREYNAIFGKGTFDMTKIQPEDPPTTISMHVVFGAGEVLIDANMPYKITSSSAFASTRLPDGNIASFGERTYVNKAYAAGKPYVSLRTDCVFGELVIKER